MQGLLPNADPLYFGVSLPTLSLFSPFSSARVGVSQAPD